MYYREVRGEGNEENFGKYILAIYSWKKNCQILQVVFFFLLLLHLFFFFSSVFTYWRASLVLLLCYCLYSTREWNRDDNTMTRNETIQVQVPRRCHGWFAYWFSHYTWIYLTPTFLLVPIFGFLLSMYPEHNDENNNNNGDDNNNNTEKQYVDYICRYKYVYMYKLVIMNMSTLEKWRGNTLSSAVVKSKLSTFVEMNMKKGEKIGLLLMV